MPPKVTITKTGRQTVDSISKGEINSAVFSDKTSPKSNVATVGSQSTPLEAPDSAVVFKKPVKGRKKTPKSNKVTVGSKSSASDSSSDFGSSIKGIPGTSIR